jgi:carboxyl-terminal processing protease
LPVGEGDLDHAIAFDRVPPARFTPEGRVTDAVVEWLQRQSSERVAANEKFVELGGQIARYKRRKDEKSISLLEEEFARQWNEGKAAEDEEEKRLEESEFSKRPVVKRDYYFDEAMNVTIDYLRSLAEAGGLAEAAQVTPPRKEPVPSLR